MKVQGLFRSKIDQISCHRPHIPFEGLARIRYMKFYYLNFFLIYATKKIGKKKMKNWKFSLKKKTILKIMLQCVTCISVAEWCNVIKIKKKRKFWILIGGVIGGELSGPRLRREWMNESLFILPSCDGAKTRPLRIAAFTCHIVHKLAVLGPFFFFFI